MVLGDMDPFVDQELRCIEAFADLEVEYSVPWAGPKLAVASSSGIVVYGIVVQLHQPVDPSVSRENQGLEHLAVVILSHSVLHEEKMEVGVEVVVKAQRKSLWEDMVGIVAAGKEHNPGKVEAEGMVEPGQPGNSPTSSLGVAAVDLVVMEKVCEVAHC